MTPSEWIKSIAPSAEAASLATGMSRDLMLAQAAQETGWGQKVLPGTNNLFNIKAESTWKGDAKTFAVSEYINGKWVTENANFRVYPSVEQSFLDRVDFLQDNKRYSDLFKPDTLGDLKKEADALQRAGYATDPDYAKNLVAVFNGRTMQRALKDLDTLTSYRNPTSSRNESNAWNTIGGGTSGFGGSTVQPGSMTNTAPNQGPGYPTPTVTQSSGGGGGNSGFGGSKVQPGSATNTAPNQGPGWAPIVIDLDGDGVEIKPLSRSSTTFDADSDGYKERSAWAGADDGLLVIDLNGDGQVTQSKEIAFSEWTAEQDTDLQALAKVFDSNGDGTFDSRDAHFSEFRIWKDANSNGVADAGEMMTLQAAGIAANDIFYRRCANV